MLPIFYFHIPSNPGIGEQNMNPSNGQAYIQKAAFDPAAESASVPKKLLWIMISSNRTVFESVFYSLKSHQG